MRKLKKSVILGLSIAALGVSTYNVSKTYALENPKSYVAQTNEARSSEVGVKDEDELISALKDPSVQKIILKNNIKISKQENQTKIKVEGKSKEIISESSTNKYTISPIGNKDSEACISFYQSASIKNVNIDNVEIIGWDLNIENSNIKNTSIRANYIKKCTIENSAMSTEWLDDSKLINTQIDERKLDSDAKIINVDIDNTNTDLKYDESTIIVGNENLTLENVNIKNKYGKGIKIEGKSDVVIEGDVKIETNKTEAISLEGSSNDNKSRLYVNGKLKQVGDTYTIKAKNDGDYTEVYDKSNILSKGLDSGGSGYYNTSLRTGNTPKLPDSSMELTKEVSTDDELVAALENPKVQEIIVLNDIEISKKEIYSMIKIEGEYKKIVGKSSTNKPRISYKFDAYIFFDVKCNKGLDITNIDFNSIRMNSDKVYIENCTIENGIEMKGQSIKNSTVVNCSISAVNIENCKLINAQIDVSRLDSDVKITNVDIDNTITKLDDYESTIWVSNENLTLKNVNIKNKSGRPLSIRGNSKVIIEGNVTIETNKTEAILLEMDYTKQMARLYVNGDLKQIGDTYTIVSKQSGVYTEVYDKNNILNSSMDKDGTAYYNTINRVGSEPKLPENNKNGWKQENKVWYYYKNGIKSKGWLKDANKWYYLGEDGKMQTGWKMVHGTWYYLNGSGAMETGWENLNGTWYYLRPSGAMATGWEKVNGTWYYLRSGGAMAKGWIDLSGTWYYLDGSGAMKTGWQKISGKWYYMYQSGAMAKNTVIDAWKINSSGVATKIK